MIFTLFEEAAHKKAIRNTTDMRKSNIKYDFFSHKAELPASTIPIKCSVQLVEFVELTNHSLKLNQTCTHPSN